MTKLILNKSNNILFYCPCYLIRTLQITKLGSFHSYNPFLIISPKIYISSLFSRDEVWMYWSIFRELTYRNITFSDLRTWSIYGFTCLSFYSELFCTVEIFYVLCQIFCILLLFLAIVNSTTFTMLFSCFFFLIFILYPPTLLSSIINSILWI